MKVDMPLSKGTEAKLMGHLKEHTRCGKIRIKSVDSFKRHIKTEKTIFIFVHMTTSVFIWHIGHCKQLWD